MIPNLLTITTISVFGIYYVSLYMCVCVLKKSHAVL